MCLYSRIIRNKKYEANKKNGGVIPPFTDQRVLHVPITCGQCIECRKQKAREWQIRLMEDIKTNTNGKFITLTFSNESIKELIEQPATKYWPSMKGLEGYELDNEIATRGIRLFLERWRKKFKKSVRHWLVTELGHNGTENIHLHGIIWTNETFETIGKIWKYGYIWPRKDEWKNNYVGNRTINYIVKYVNKIDIQHKTYKSKILTSDGIGENYSKGNTAKDNKYKEHKTNETYRTSTGHKIALPVYWRNKIYTEEEKEKLWIEKLNKQERWICGEKIDISETEEIYYRILRHYRKLNAQLGYGTGDKSWSRAEYEKQRRTLMIETRVQAAKRKNKAQQ